MLGLAARFGAAPPSAAGGGEVYYLWPENVRAWGVWLDVQTQWRVGMQGATGLDYAGVGRWIDEQGLEGEERCHVWACIRAAESAVLEVLNGDTASGAPRG